jgi:hypothetical protein
MTRKIGGKVSRKIHFPLPQFDSGKESFFDGFHDNLLTLVFSIHPPDRIFKHNAFCLAHFPFCTKSTTKKDQ